MHRDLEQFVEQLIPQKISRRTRKELRAELASHVCAELHDLELQGIPEQQAIVRIIQNFGDNHMITKQLEEVHRFDYYLSKAKKIAAYTAYAIGLNMVLSLLFQEIISGSFPIISSFALPVLGMLFILNPPFILITAFSTLYVALLARYAFGFFPKEERRLRAMLTLALGTIFLWVSLMASYQPLSDSAQPLIYGTGGFPVTAFKYSYQSDAKTSQWLMFGIDALVWLVIATIAGFAIPSRWLTWFKKEWVLIGIGITMIITLFNSGAYLLFRFD